MQKWQYQFVTYFTTTGIVVDWNGRYYGAEEKHYLEVAHKLGEKGWELISAVSPEDQVVILAFKRLLPVTPPKDEEGE